MSNVKKGQIYQLNVYLIEGTFQNGRQKCNLVTYTDVFIASIWVLKFASKMVRFGLVSYLLLMSNVKKGQICQLTVYLIESTFGRQNAILVT